MAEQKEQSVSFRISYFGIGGRAAALRAAAFLSGLSYEDEFVTGAMHGAAKAAGKRRWNGIPELTLYDATGKTVALVGQSNVCLKLIGLMGGMYPKNIVQAAMVDELCAACEDLVGVLAPSFGKDEETLKKMRAEMVADKTKLPYWMSKFEARLTENEARGCKNGYFVGDSMTVGDLKAFFGMKAFYEGFFDHLDGKPLFKAAPKCDAFRQKMEADENIQKFMAAFKAQQEATKADEKKTVHVIKGKNVYAEM